MFIDLFTAYYIMGVTDSYLVFKYLLQERNIHTSYCSSWGNEKLLDRFSTMFTLNIQTDMPP